MLIRSVHLPWLIVGDFNRSPQEIAASTWCQFLNGVVTAPNVPFTCTNTSEAGGSLIDFVVHARELEPYLKVRPIFHYPFKPHVVSLRVLINKAVQPDRHPPSHRCAPGNCADSRA